MIAAADAARIIVIDDDFAIRLACEKILARAGYRVETHEDGERGLAAVSERRPDLCVVDLKMPGLSGLEVVSRIHAIDPLIIVVVITGYATVETAVDAMKEGAYDFLPKPFTPDELRIIIERGLERRQLQLGARAAELEREMLKRKFLSFVSHQLRTPLVAIHQYLEVMKRLGDAPGAAEKRADWIDRCLARTSELQDLIDDWLTLSRLEGGRSLAREIRPIDVRPVVETVVRSYEEMARQEDVRLVLELPEHGPVALGDRNCVSVLVDNLVTNAIKYNRPGGSVVVGARERDGEVVLTVRDTGVGIAAENRERLFDEYYRVREEGAGAPRGTGLGLPICRRIVDELGGAIDVESELGVGSTFRVRLPAAETSGEEGEGAAGAATGPAEAGPDGSA
ncbi:MAG: hybrid sensor histidine kinase/response regulator [Gemmatimonadota bacterium]